MAPKVIAKHKVMISSTARDLPDHRDEIREGCERAGFEPHMMEKLPALDADAIVASLELVDDADVYVGVFAFRYGYVPDGYDISITEMEYNRAVELKKPRLIFFMDDDHPVKRKDNETEGTARQRTCCYVLSFAQRPSRPSRRSAVGACQKT
jgi:hypothetical protein